LSVRSSRARGALRVRSFGDQDCTKLTKKTAGSADDRWHKIANFGGVGAAILVTILCDVSASSLVTNPLASPLTPARHTRWACNPRRIPHDLSTHFHPPRFGRIARHGSASRSALSIHLDSVRFNFCSPTKNILWVWQGAFGVRKRRCWCDHSNARVCALAAARILREQPCRKRTTRDVSRFNLWLLAEGVLLSKKAVFVLFWYWTNTNGSRDTRARSRRTFARCRVHAIAPWPRF